MNGFLLVGLWLGAEPAAIVHYIFEAAKEGRMAMQIDLTILRLVPFRIEQQVSCVTQFFNLLCVKLDTVGNREGVVVRHLFLVNPLPMSHVSRL